MVFPNKITLEYDLPCIIWKDGIFFWKMWYFFGRKIKDDLSQKIHGNNVFLYIYLCVNVTNMILPFCKKNQRWPSPKKIHLKVIDILDCILGRVPTNLCTFTDTSISVFIYCFPVKKPKKLNRQDWNLTSSSIYLVGDILQ